MSIKKAAGLFFLLALFACTPEPLVDPVDGPGEQQKTEEPEPEKHVDPVMLTFIEKGKNGINASLDESGGVWTLTSTTADPFIYTSALESDLGPEHRVLCFEYLCVSGIDDLQVFYGNYITEQRSRHFGAIPPAGTWKEFSCSLASDIVKFNWGKQGDKLRLDWGNKSNIRIQIRNIRIREMNAAELKAYEAELSKAQGKEAEAGRISNYLVNSYPCSITSVEVGKTEVTVKGTTDGSSGYYVADIGPWESLTEITSFTLKAAVSGNTFTVTMPRIVDRNNIPKYDRVLSRFAVVRLEGSSQTLCSHARYADSIEPVSNPAPLAPKTKKGLGGFVVNNNLSDLDDLGITSVTVNIVLNSLVNTERSGNYMAQWQFGGITYYMNSGYASQLDRVMAECRKRGIVVSAILLNRQSDTQSKATALMKHPECDGGNYSMPNLTSPAAVNVYAAALDYLASRYSSDNFGRIHHWILHNEVDFQKEWTNMGDQPELRYMDSYVRSMRICHNLAHKYDPNSSVMISLTHSWARAEGQYASKSLLEDLCMYSSAEGDFLWGVAYHPYPQNLTLPQFWKDDTSSTYSLNSSFCTFKNLEVVNAWVMDKAHFYRGTSKRLLFLSENGTNSPSYSETDLARQAAGAAWAWKKTDALEGIDGIQWHNWQDNRAEGGLRIGLRRFKDDSEDPNGKKPAWYVWQAAGTSSEDSVFAPYLPVIGISSWSEIFGSL